MNCGFCGGKCIWQSDFDADAVGYDEEGIVTYYVCSECGAEWEGYQRFEREGDK